MVTTRAGMAGALVVVAAFASARADEAAQPSPAAAEKTATARKSSSLAERESLTCGCFGLDGMLKEQGVELVLGLTQVYQQNLRGGLKHDRGARDYEGSYDIEVGLDLGKILGVQGGSIHALTEGSWSNGLDDKAVGSLFGANADAAGDETAVVSQLYYEQAFFDGKAQLRLGKIDLTGGFQCRGCPVAFDGNVFANDPTAQFLNGALRNNPTIPFPEPGLGVTLYSQPTDWMFVGAGAADARSRVTKTGFTTAFNGADRWLYIAETGVVPRIPIGDG